MSDRSVAASLRVFNADDVGFQMAAAAASLSQNQAVILFAQTTEQSWLDGTSLLGLGAAEVRRFHSFRSRTAATVFLQSRRLLRNLLATYAGCNSDQIDVRCEEHVKPDASSSTAVRSMPQFNMSHSGGWVVLAAHRDYPLGVDIEFAGDTVVDTFFEMPNLFTRTEHACLTRCTDQHARADLFLQLWRCKEAVLKATGRGFDLSPTSFEVLTDEGAFKSLVRAESQDWHLQQITLCHGLDCALAVRAA